MATAQPVFYVVMVTGVEAQAIYNKVEMARSSDKDAAQRKKGFQTINDQGKCYIAL